MKDIILGRPFGVNHSPNQPATTRQQTSKAMPSKSHGTLEQLAAFVTQVKSAASHSARQDKLERITQQVKQDQYLPDIEQLSDQILLDNIYE